MTTSVSGFLEPGDGMFLNGWAFDLARPGARIDVELRLSTGEVAIVRADQFRADLLKQGIGDGRHGFCVPPPPQAFGGSIRVSAHVAGSGPALQDSPMRVRTTPIQNVAADIVDNCNLRCPFCLVDYSNMRGLRQMTAETYRKMLALMPLVADGGAWLSCLHEPTLHSRLMEMISETPAELRRKLSFTTNLCKRLDDRTLQALAESGVHHMRISYDTFDPQLFARLRKGGIYTTFIDNLSRLSEYIKRSSSPLRLGFVTMALTDNRDHIPELVRRCADLYQPFFHEVRFIYYQPHLAEWGREHMLSLAEWNELASRLKSLPPPVLVALDGPYGDAIEQYETAEGADNYQAPTVSIGNSYGEELPPNPDPEILGRSLRNEPLKLRMRWDGLIVLGDRSFINLNELGDPAGFFRLVRSSAQSDADGVWRRP